MAPAQTATLAWRVPSHHPSDLAQEWHAARPRPTAFVARAPADGMAICPSATSRLARPLAPARCATRQWQAPSHHPSDLAREWLAARPRPIALPDGVPSGELARDAEPDPPPAAQWP